LHVSHGFFTPTEFFRIAPLGLPRNTESQLLYIIVLGGHGNEIEAGIAEPFATLEMKMRQGS